MDPTQRRPHLGTRADGHGRTRHVAPRTATAARSSVTLGAAALALLVSVAAPLASCTSDDRPDPHDDRTASVYVAIVDWFAAAESADPEPLPVFVEPRGDGATIPLEAQATVVAATEEHATVRFIDAREEALVEDDEGRLVAADDGVLLRLPPVDQIARPVVADVDVHLQDDRFLTLRFELVPEPDGWRLVGPPEQIATPEEGQDSTDPTDSTDGTAP